MGENGREESPSLKRNNSALNVARLLKKSISKHNLRAGASESPVAHSSNQQMQMNGHSTPNFTQAGSEQDTDCTNSDHQMETVSQKLNRKKDHFLLSTVAEETSGGAEMDQLTYCW